MLLESCKLVELFLRGIERGLTELIDIARDRVGLIIYDVFYPSEELVAQCCDLLFLITLSEAFAHLLNMLKTHIAAVLEDQKQSLSL